MENILKLYRKTVVTVLLLSVCYFAAFAQEEAMRREYESVNRKPAFLKEYIAALKAADGDIAPVLDEWLMTLPTDERYAPANLRDVIAYIERPDRAIVGDILCNWDVVTVGAELKDSLAKKIGDLFIQSMSDTVHTGRRGAPAAVTIELPALSPDKAAPLGGIRGLLIAMWPAYGQTDAAMLISGLTALFDMPEQTNDLLELIVLGKYLNTVLEYADLQQSREMIGLLERTVERFPEGHYSSIMRQLRVNFEGKIMMIEAGGE